MLTIVQISSILNGEVLQSFDLNETIEHITIDSRKPSPLSHSLFIAISGLNHDGHEFISDMISKESNRETA